MNRVKWNAWVWIGIGMTVVMTSVGRYVIQKRRESLVPRPRWTEIFRKVDGRELTVDIYRDDDSGVDLLPVIVFIHGGGWVSCDRNEFAYPAFEYSRKGYVAVCPDYRLCVDGKTKLSDSLSDVRYCIQWIRAHADRFGADPTRMAAMGLSAGGHMACMLGLTEGRDPEGDSITRESSHVNWVVDLSGLVDLTTEINPDRNRNLPRAELRLADLVGSSSQDAPARYRQLSPLYHVGEERASFLIVHGDMDTVVPVGQARRFRDALLKEGYPLRYHEFKGEGHIFQNLENRSQFYGLMSAFLQDSLR